MRQCLKAVDHLLRSFNNQSAQIEPPIPWMRREFGVKAGAPTAGQDSSWSIGWPRRLEALRRTPPPEPEPYEVVCACTHRLNGMRLPAFQVVRCNRCGNFVFVLPLDVYPRLKSKKEDGFQVVARYSPGFRRRTCVIDVGRIDGEHGSAKSPLGRRRGN